MVNSDRRAKGPREFTGSSPTGCRRAAVASRKAISGQLQVGKLEGREPIGDCRALTAARGGKRGQAKAVDRSVFGWYGAVGRADRASRYRRIYLNVPPLLHADGGLALSLDHSKGVHSPGKPARLKPPGVRMKDRRKILKEVPKLRKIKPAKPGR